MAGIAAAFFVLRLWTPAVALSVSGSAYGKAVIAVVTAVFIAIAFSIYAWLGKPGLGNQSAAMVGGHVNVIDTQGGAASSSAGPGSMAEAAARLAAKLARGGGADADWQLLQQSYEFMGDAESASLAQQHKLKSVSSAAAETASAAMAGNVPDRAALVSYQQLVAKNPKDPAAWLAIAQLQRAARDFSAATAAFEHVVTLKAMDANAWADYADAAASVTGSLANPKTRTAIDAALKLEPRHSKALWLKASLAHEEKRYPDALKVWQQLRAVMPDNSPDIAVVDANIQEAQSLAGGSTESRKELPAAQPVGGSVAASVHGSVALAPALKQHVTPDMTLFVYAKAPGSPAPVAAYRKSVTSLPVSFVLDDSQAMMPGRKLSQFEQVTVEARLSASGQALAQSGDLQADAVTVSTHAAQPIALQISKLVP